MRKIRRNIEKKKNKKPSNIQKAVFTFGLSAAMAFMATNSAYAEIGLPQAAQLDANVTTNVNGDTFQIQHGSGQLFNNNWNSFDVPSTKTVDFNFSQNGQVSVNRVVGNQVSQILGKMTQSGGAGQVFLLNPHGIMFGKDSSVNLGSFTASTADLTIADFEKGIYKFEQGSIPASIVNEGTIKVSDEGFVALMAPVVKNTGTIEAKSGTIGLVSGNKYTLTTGSGQDVSIKVDEALSKGLVDSNEITLIKNSGIIKADGGSVIISSKAMDDVIQNAVNNEGLISANSVTEVNGQIVLGNVTLQTNKDIVNTGTIEAAGKESGQKGGTIHVLANDIKIIGNSKLDATGKSGGGEILVGGSYQNTKPEIQQAVKTYIGKDAVLDASATDNGDGGTVVAWSDITNANSKTDAYGTFFAKAGANGGNGGNIETSGYTVDFSGSKVSASSSKGKAGLWLLDPADLTIDQTLWDALDSYKDTLEGGTSITDYVTSNNIITSGSLGVNLMNGDVTLTLKADGTITNNANIIATGDNKLNVVLWADSDNSIGGNIVQNGAITTNGGHLWMGGGTESVTKWNGLTVGDGYAKGIADGTSSGIYISNGAIFTNGGDIAMHGKGTTTATSAHNPDYKYKYSSGIYTDFYHDYSINSGTGKILLEGISDYTNTTEFESGSGIFLNRGTLTSAATTGNDAITIIGNADAVLSPSGYGILVGAWGTETANTIQATGGGNIVLTGNGSRYSNENNGIFIAQGINGYKNNIITTGGGNITLTGSSNATNATSIYSANTNVINSSGNLTFNGLTHSIGLDSQNIAAGTTTFNVTGDITATNINNDFGGAVSVTSANDVTITDTNDLTIGAINNNGDITIQSGEDLTLNSTITTDSTTPQTAIFKANGDILLSNATIQSGSSNVLNVILNSDLDGSGPGGIKITGSTITSQGGNITLGGGTAGDGSGYTGGLSNNTYLAGIVIDKATLSAGGGNISLKGKGSSLSSPDQSKGIELRPDNGNVTLQTTGNGTITLDGQGGNSTASCYGVNLNNYNGNGHQLLISSESGDINITGVGGTGSADYGVMIESTSSTSTNTLATTGGHISITGTTDGGSASGVSIGQYSTIGSSSTGDITLTSHGGAITSTGTISNNGNLNLTSDGNININGAISSSNTVGKTATFKAVDSIIMDTNSSISSSTNPLNVILWADSDASNGGYVQIKNNIATSGGDLWIGGGSGSTTWNELTVGDGYAQGKTGQIQNGFFLQSGTISTGSGDIYIAGKASVSDSNSVDTDSLTTISGNNLTVKGSVGRLYMGGKDLISGTTTFDATGLNIIASNDANDFGGIVSVTNGNDVSILDSNAMTLGDVNASGKINIATLTGDLTVSGNIHTNNATADAIILNAGKSAVVGNIAGGDIKITATGTPITTGTGGIVKLYTGSLAGSTGVISSNVVASGSGNFRYNSDETTTNFNNVTKSLTTPDSRYAIYREQPTVTVTATNDSKTYDGQAYTGGNGVTYSGFINGDTAANINGTLSYLGTSQGALNANTYAITASGLTSDLGYGIGYTNGTLTIEKIALDVKVDASKTYGDTSASSPVTTLSGFVNGEDATSANITGAGGVGSVDNDGLLATANAGGTYRITADTSGLSATNYSFNSLDTGLLTVNKKALDVKVDASKTYGETSASSLITTLSGFVNGEDVTSANVTGAGGVGSVDNSGLSGTANVGGTYHITSTTGDLSATNYSFTSSSAGLLNVNQKGLTIAADDYSRTKGHANPEFTAKYTGLVNADSESSLGTLNLSTSADFNSLPGNYEIVPLVSIPGVNFNNYHITYGTGTLNIKADTIPANTVTSNNLVNHAPELANDTDVNRITSGATTLGAGVGTLGTIGNTGHTGENTSGLLSESQQPESVTPQPIALADLSTGNSGVSNISNFSDNTGLSNLSTTLNDSVSKNPSTIYDAVFSGKSIFDFFLKK